MTTFGELCCEVCGASGSKTAMHRANPKGEKGQWRCASCLAQPIDETTVAVIERIENEGLVGLLGTGVEIIDMDAPMTEEQIAWVRAQRGR